MVSVTPECGVRGRRRRRAAVLMGPVGRGRGDRVGPVGLTVAGVGVDGVRGAVEGDDRNRSRRRAGRRAAQSADRRDRGEHVRGVAGELAGGAGAAGEAGRVDPRRVDAVGVLEDADELREERHVVGGVRRYRRCRRSAARRARSSRTRCRRGSVPAGRRR